MPAKRIVAHLPHAEVISSVSRVGIVAASSELDISLDQLKTLYLRGAETGIGSELEFRHIVSQLIHTELQMRVESATPETFHQNLSIMSDLYGYMIQNKDQDLVGSSEAVLGDDPETLPIIKFFTGHQPLDMAVGGLYNGILMCMGRSGHGKTTHMLSWMEHLRQVEGVGSLWFYEAEISLPLMLYRMMPSRKRVKFGKDDRIITGMNPIKDIVTRVKDNPDPDRVIFIDSPDLMTMGSGDGRRFALEEAYRDLVRLKELCKCVIVSSQGRRQDRELTLDSAAEAAAKVYYSDIVLTITKSTTVGDWSSVRYQAVKNRFGKVDQPITFRFDYGSLKYDQVRAEDTEYGDGEDDSEDSETSGW